MRSFVSTHRQKLFHSKSVIGPARTGNSRDHCRFDPSFAFQPQAIQLDVSPVASRNRAEQGILPAGQLPLVVRHPETQVDALRSASVCRADEHLRDQQGPGRRVVGIHARFVRHVRIPEPDGIVNRSLEFRISLLFVPAEIRVEPDRNGTFGRLIAEDRDCRILVERGGKYAGTVPYAG